MLEPFGSVLREIRQSEGLTQADLAEHLGLSTSYVSDVECGRRSPFSGEALTRVVKYLGGSDSLEKLSLAAAHTIGEVTVQITKGSPRSLATLLIRLRSSKLKESQVREAIKCLVP